MEEGRKEVMELVEQKQTIKTRGRITSKTSTVVRKTRGTRKE